MLLFLQDLLSFIHFRCCYVYITEVKNIVSSHPALSSLIGLKHPERDEQKPFCWEKLFVLTWLSRRHSNKNQTTNHRTPHNNTCMPGNMACTKYLCSTSKNSDQFFGTSRAVPVMAGRLTNQISDNTHVDQWQPRSQSKHATDVNISTWSLLTSCFAVS